MVKIPVEWLTERVEDAPTSYHRKISPTAALRIRMAWQKLKLQAEERDELWAFSSPRASSNREGKYIGYALVRDGSILQSVVVTQE